MKKLLFALFLPAILLAGCSKDDNAGKKTNRPVAVQFTSDITKVSGDDGNVWDAGDAIGVYMLGTTADADVANREYTASAGTTAAFTAAGEELYYPEDGSDVQFVAYYPYDETVGSDNTLPINVADQSNQSAIDVLYSATGASYNSSTPTATLNFQHKLVKLHFDITAGEGEPDLTGLTVQITNQQTAGSMDLTTGNVTTTAGTPTTISAYVSADGKSADAIVLPAAATAGMQFVFTTADGKSVTLDVPQSVWVAGRYPYPVTLNGEGGTITPDKVAVQFTGSIGIGAPTRVSGNGWDGGEQVGIYMLGESGALTADNIIDNAANRAYTASAGTPAALSAADDIIYYPADGSNVTFRAYYPYTASVGSDYTIPVDVADQSDQSAIDVMYAHADIHNSATPAAQLYFTPVLSKLHFDIIAGENATDADLAGLRVQITNQQTAGLFDLNTGKVTAADGTPTSITALTAADGKTADALVLPASAADVQFVFTTADGRSMTDYVPSSITWEAGVVQTFQIQLNLPAPDTDGVTISLDFAQGVNIATPALPTSANAGAARTEYTMGGYTFAIYADAAQNGKFYWIDNAQYPGTIDPKQGLYFSKSGAYVEFPAIAGLTLSKVTYTPTGSQSSDVILDIMTADDEDAQYSMTYADDGAWVYELIDAQPDTAYRLEALKSNAQMAKLTLEYVPVE